MGMNLYHFTNLRHLQHIEKEGLSRGDIPITETKAANGVWLTTNDEWNRDVLAWAGKPGLLVLDKTFIRLTVNISDDDPALISWKEYAKINKVPKRWYRRLDEVGGYQSDNWFLYLGKISSEKIIKKEYRENLPAEAIEKELKLFYEKYEVITKGTMTYIREK